MKKAFQFIGFAVLFLVIGALIDRFYLKPKPVAFDEEDIPKELEVAKVIPDKIVDEEKYIEALANSERLEEEINDLENAIVYLREKAKVVKRVERGEIEKDTTQLVIKLKSSHAEARWTLNKDGDKLIPMEKPYNNDWYAMVNIKSEALTPVYVEEIKPNIRWKKHYENFREPKIAQDLYNRGAVGMIKGAVGTAALFSGNEYVAGTGIIIIVDEVFQFGIINFLSKIF